MSFLSPLWLWSLLALIPLGLVYFLKIRPVRRRSNAYFLWDKIFQESQTSALFQRLRDLFSLLLMLLAFAAVAFALSRPRLTSAKDSDLLIVIDTSVSMQAQSGSKSRIQEAKEEAKGIIRALNGDHRAAIATVDSKLSFRTHLTSNPRELLDAVNAIEATDVALSMQAARGLTSYTSKPISGELTHRVVFLTDGSAALPDLGEAVELLAVGETKPNLGIVAADLQWTSGQPSTASFYIRIENSHTQSVNTELELRHDATRMIGKLIPVKLEPGKAFEEVFQIDQAQAGAWTASLSDEDALSADNQVSLGLNTRQPVAVAINVENPWFFQNCVQAFSRSGGLLQAKQKDAAITLLEANSESNTACSIIFKPKAESPWWSSLGEELDFVIPKVLQAEHPLTRHLDIQGITFSGAVKLTAPEGSLILIEAQDGTPLMYKCSREGQTVVVLNMDPAQDDFFLSPWFPAIVHSSTLHLVGRENEVLPLYQTGSTITIPGTDENTQLTLPDGSSKIIAGGAQLDLVKAGAYLCATDGNQWVFGAAPLSSEDSRLAIMSEGSKPALASGWPPSLWLLVFAVTVLTIEAILYHRRKVG